MSTRQQRQHVLQVVSKPEDDSTKKIALRTNTHEDNEKHNSNKNTDGTVDGCCYCDKHGHIKAEFFKKKRNKAENDEKKDTYVEEMIPLVKSISSPEK